MDDLTAKRIEGDITKFQGVAAGMTYAVASAVEKVDAMNLGALEAEYQRWVPGWASDLTTMPLTMLTFCMARLRSIGAPPEYLMALVGTLLDEDAPRLWPQPGVARPAWVIEKSGCAECGDENPMGGAADAAAQVIRLLALIYNELGEIIEAEAILSGVISGSPNSEEEAAQGVQIVNARTLDLMAFILKMFAGTLAL